MLPPIAGLSASLLRIWVVQEDSEQFTLANRKKIEKNWKKKEKIIEIYFEEENKENKQSENKKFESLFN